MGCAALSRDDGLVPDFKVAGRSLPGPHPDSAAQVRRACQAHLGCEDRVLADLSAMADLNQVVQFCAAPDDGIADRGPVYGCVGPDLHVILDDDPAGLADFIKSAVPGRCEAKPVTADNRAILNDHAVSDPAAFAHDHVGVKHHFIPETNARIQNDMRIKGNPRADPAIVADDGIGADTRTRADFGTRRNRGGRMHAGFGTEGRVKISSAFAKARYGSSVLKLGMETGGMSSPRMIADARVVLMWLTYFRLETNVRSPGPASSIPVTRVISTSSPPDIRHPILSAIWDSFIATVHRPGLEYETLW